VVKSSQDGASADHFPSVTMNRPPT
jgi:hypothetical protein